MPKDAEPHYDLGLAYIESGNAQAGARELISRPVQLAVSRDNRRRLAMTSS